MVYGYYTKKIKTEQAFLPTKCPNCESTGSMELEVICKVNHLLFVPFIPADKRVVVQCRSCNGAYKMTAFPQLETQSEILMKSTRYKWYQYTGLVLFIFLLTGLFVGIWLGSKETDRRNAAALEQIKTGDVIFFKTSDKKNTTMKVARVNNDTVWVYENKLVTNQTAREIDEDQNYDSRETFFLRPRMKSMLDKDIITDIDY